MRWFVALMAGLALAPLPGAVALAQSEIYPSRLIRIIHQYTPGGGNDLVARIIATALSERWHQSVIVEPRPGGGGIIGADAVAKAPPDGYTLLVTNTALSMLPALGKPLPFDVPGSFAPDRHRDLRPMGAGRFQRRTLSLAQGIGRLCVRPAGPGRLFVGRGRLAASFDHGNAQSADRDRPLPRALQGCRPSDAGHGRRPGPGRILLGLLGDRADPIRRGAGAGGAERGGSALLPDTPTVIEAGIPDFVTDSWYGILAPAGTPKPIVDRLAAAVTAIFADPALREKLAAQDMVAVEGSTPASFAARIAQETRMWREVVAKQRLKLE